MFESAAVWNRISGLRARCGNYNSPCNIGEFMEEISPKNTLQLYWEDGTSIANAAVEIYYAQSFSGVWYARQFGNTPDVSFTTDDNGQYLLEESPFSANGDIVHTYGNSNAISLIKVTTPDTVGVQIVDITQFNLPYWQGELNPIIPITFRNTIPTSSGAEFSSTEKTITSSSSLINEIDVMAVAQSATGSISFLDMTDGSPISPSLSSGSFPTWLALDNTNNHVFVANAGSDSVSIIDQNTLTIQDTITVGDNPRSLAVDTLGEFLYVSNNGTNDISVININDGAVVTTIETISNPEQIIMSSVASTAFAVSNSPGRVSILNTDLNTAEDW